MRKVTRGDAPHDSVLREVQKMAATVQRHRALDNRFYKLWMREPLKAGQVEVVAVNYYMWIAPTVQRIAWAFLLMEDIEARAETAHNLLDELGNGDPEAVHVLLLRRFLDELLSKVHGRDFRLADARAAVLPETRRLNEGGMKLFQHSPQVACGALLAQEWHAYTQLVNLYEGVRNYMDLFELDHFHEVCEYFYIHIGAAEKEHKEQSLVSAARVCRSEEDLPLLSQGFYGFLDLLAAFWEALYEAVMSVA